MHAFGEQECISHSTANGYKVGNMDKLINYIDLVGYFSTTDDRHERPLRVLHNISDCVDFLFEQETGHTWQVVRDGVSTGMGALHHPESILHKYIREACELSCEHIVIFFLFRMETEIFKERHLPGLQARSYLLG